MNLLLADIGGTNARFAFKKNDKTSITNFEYLKCSNFVNIFEAINYYKNKNKLEINNMSMIL